MQPSQGSFNEKYSEIEENPNDFSSISNDCVGINWENGVEKVEKLKKRVEYMARIGGKPYVANLTTLTQQAKMKPCNVNFWITQVLLLLHDGLL